MNPMTFVSKFCSASTIFVGCVVLGCSEMDMSRHPPGTVEIGSVIVEFQPVPNALSIIKETNEEEHYIFADNVGVILRGRELSVEGVSYGSVNIGDRVLISKGTVSINGVPRDGERKSD